MRLIFIIVDALFLLNAGLNAQVDSVVTVDSFLIKNSHIVFMQNTVEFNGPFLAALEKFPELSDFSIEVKRKHIFTMMAARPGRGFIFQPREKRRYVILITNKPDMNADSVYSQADKDAVIGLFGHELCHLLDYQDKSNFEMLCFGISYYFNRKKIEHRTDMIAIQRGFGDNLVKYNQFIRHNNYVNKQYLQRKNKYYLSETDIEFSMKKSVL